MSHPFPPTALQHRHAQTVRDSSSSYKIDYVIVIRSFLNPEGHQNPRNGSKVTAILLKGWILPVGGASAVEGLQSTGLPRLVFFFLQFFPLICNFLPALVLMLLSAHVKRFSVSHIIFSPLHFLLSYNIPPKHFGHSQTSAYKLKF